MGTEEELLPELETEEQEAEYWDTHSPLDLAAEPRAQKVRVRGAKDKPITIRLDSETRKKLNKLAVEQGLGPSTFARSILMAAIEKKGDLPKSINLDDLREMLEHNLPQSMKEQAEYLMEATSIGEPDNPTLLILDNSQMNEFGELGLQAISILLAIYGVEVITQEHTKYEEVKTLVQSGTQKGHG